jgi:hypothetical protein
MICTRIRIMPASPQTFNNYDEYMDWLLAGLGSNRETFVQAREEWFNTIKGLVQNGYIKNLTVMEWDQSSNSAINEFFSDDLLMAREFLKQLRESPASTIMLNSASQQNDFVTVILETEPKTVIPFVDSKRIFDEDIGVLV